MENITRYQLHMLTSIPNFDKQILEQKTTGTIHLAFDIELHDHEERDTQEYLPIALLKDRNTNLEQQCSQKSFTLGQLGQIFRRKEDTPVKISWFWLSRIPQGAFWIFKPCFGSQNNA